MVAAMRQSAERGVDFETDGLQYANGKGPVGYSLGFVASDGMPYCWYVPFGHRRAEPQADRASAIRAFADALDGAKSIVAHHAKFEINMARANGFAIPFVPIHCTLVQSYLVYEARAFDLESLAADITPWRDPYEMKKLVQDFLALRAREYKMGKQAYLDEFGHCEVPINLEAEYSCRDVAHSLRLHHANYHSGKVLLAGTAHEPKRKILYENEMLLVRAIADMEYAGQLVDADYLRRQAAALDQDLEDRGRGLDRAWGASIKWTNDNEVREFLFTHKRLKVIERTDHGQPKVDRSTLLQLRAIHPEWKPALELMAEYNARHKVRTTYTTSLADLVCKDGRIHCNFKQFGTKTGRLSGAEPNLQNIPTRHKEMKKLIRKAFYVQEGYGRIYADYSQIELRVLAWATGSAILTRSYYSPSWIEYRNGTITYDEYRERREHEPSVDVHADQAKNTFGSKPTDADWDVKRRAAKIINFGVPYGMGPHGLNTNPELLLPIEDAKRYFDAYGAANPEIAATKRALFNKMRSERGVPKFIGWAGRTVHSNAILSSDDDRRSEAERSVFASLIQGSAGELTRFSMVRTWLARLAGELPAVGTSTVHDEIQYDVPLADLPEAAKKVQQIMEDFHGCFGGIPVVCEIEVTDKTWADKMKITEFLKARTAA